MSRCQARRGCHCNCYDKWSHFPTQEIVPYDTAFLSGHVVEHYKVVLLDAAKQSRDQMYAALESLCGQQVPGDTYRNLQIHPGCSRARRSNTCSSRCGC